MTKPLESFYGQLLLTLFGIILGLSFVILMDAGLLSRIISLFNLPQSFFSSANLHGNSVHGHSCESFTCPCSFIYIPAPLSAFKSVETLRQPATTMW